jgi:pyridoxamine 5'-phosphate oxidase
MPQYTRNPPLCEADLAADPAAQFQVWLTAAVEAGMYEPNAMALATVDAASRPSVRIVLFKGFHEGGPTFYTNYNSRKGREMAAQPQVAATFWWDRMERQVRLEGRVEKLPAAVSEAYFRARPRLSQIGATVSRQSQVVATREELDARLAAAERHYGEDTEVPRPPHWGGYRIEVDRWEFWQGRGGRLHDRLLYVRAATGGWIIERLEP